MTGDRLGCRQEPRFELSLGQDDVNAPIAPRRDRSVEHDRREFLRAVVVRIDEDEDLPVRSGLPSGQLDGTFQLALFQEALPMDADRPRHLEWDSRRDRVGDPPDQDRNRLALTVTLDDGCDPRQGSRLRIEQLELPVHREFRVGPELIHAE